MQHCHQVAPTSRPEQAASLPGQRINNLSARRINNPVAVARIINPAHGGDNGANPALGQSLPLEDSRHSITGWNCAERGDSRCRGLLCPDRDQPLALLREGNHSLGHSLEMPSTVQLWTGIDLNRLLFTPPTLTSSPNEGSLITQ